MLTRPSLQVFYEEELDVPLVLFDEVLDHVLRIDRIFRQPQGHLLLIGVSGAGKTTLSRFVAWMNGLSIFQIKVGPSIVLLSLSIGLGFAGYVYRKEIICLSASKGGRFLPVKRQPTRFRLQVSSVF